MQRQRGGAARLQPLGDLTALPLRLAKHHGQTGPRLGLRLGLGATASRRQDSAQHRGPIYPGRQEQRRLAQERAVDLYV